MTKELPRATNAQLVAQLRHLLTNGFFTSYESRVDRETGLAATKEWRREVWRALNEVEERLCPRPPKRPETNAQTPMDPRARKLSTR